MRSNNNHETITHLAMPERQIPVLIDSSPEKAEGYVPSIGWSEKPLTTVRRLQPSFIDGLRNPRKRREIETEHGTISATEWNLLRELLDLLDRLNAGDKSHVTASNAEEALEDSFALLNRLSPGGWFVEENQPGTGKLVFRQASGEGRLVLNIGEPTIEPFGNEPLPRNADQHLKPVTETDGNTTWGVTVTGTCKAVTFAISEAFTAGLSKTRFVVWWSDVGKKLVPGLYCPDIVTALYALAMWSSGTAGGWAICQRCKKDYPRSRAKQRYCTHKCQVAAAMQRLRDRAKSAAPKDETSAPKTKKRTGRK